MDSNSYTRYTLFINSKACSHFVLFLLSFIHMKQRKRQRTK
jgi:heme/copper-type cytochrome/quinol oxidase subunit 4